MNEPEDATPDAADAPAAAATPPVEPVDPMSRLFASTALGLAALALIEIIGSISVGLAVSTGRLSFLHRQGYAFLTQLEKSPVSLMLVVGAFLAAYTTIWGRTDTRTARLATVALWVTVAAAVLVGLGAILAVLARFRVAELASSQPIDSITRRVLFTFIVRNFGAAVLALLIAFGALFRKRLSPAVID